MTENLLSNRIVGAAIEVHKELGGPGLLESVYEEALMYELKKMGLDVQRQKNLSIIYKGVELEKRFVLDLLVDNKVVVEVKAIDKLNSVCLSQLLTYLRVGNYRLGMLLNFGNTYLKDGIHRVVNRCPEN